MILGTTAFCESGATSQARSKINLDLADFLVKSEQNIVQAGLIKNSVQWIRNEHNLLSPNALIGIIIKKTTPTTHITYLDKKIIPVKKNGFYYTQFYIDLFDPKEITIYDGAQILDTISVSEISRLSDGKRRIYLDYSCAPYLVSIEGVDSQYSSVGCVMHKTGPLGKENSRLEIYLNAGELRMNNGARAPFSIYLDDNSPVEMQIRGLDKTIKTLTIKAQFPKRSHRLKSAFGFGPYLYDSFKRAQKSKNNPSLSLMYYGKFDLTKTSSFKFFDAIIYSKSFFNNSGVYFSYDLGEVFDGRVVFNALLGAQGLHYRYTKSDPMTFNVIYPQGFEMMYKHFNGMENIHLTYGMFIGTGAHKYINSWLRFGGSKFLELNYIRWAHDDSEIKTWGLSVGLPLFTAF